MDCQYRAISSFGNKAGEAPTNDPLSYCVLTGLDSSFLHGGTGEVFGPHSKHCQMFMAEYCAKKWDGVCEYASKNTNINYPNDVQECNSMNMGGCGAPPGLANRYSAGQILLRNTASKKYLTAMSGNCEPRYEPFDPTVASSPLISWWEPKCHMRGSCIPMYEVKPHEIDNDPVMNKILEMPAIAIDILVNIYNTAKRKGTLEELKGTKLYKFFQSKDFLKIQKISEVKAQLQLGK